jgi:hypothetical protein
MSLNTLSGLDSRDLSVRDPAGRIRVSAWFCQTLSEVPACYLGITRGRVRTFYLPVLPLYGFTKLYTNPFIIYLLPNFKPPVLVLFWGLEQKKLNPCSHSTFPDCSCEYFKDMATKSLGKRGGWASCKRLYFVFTVIGSLNSDSDAFIHAPSFSFNEVKQILESGILAYRIP